MNDYAAQLIGPPAPSCEEVRSGNYDRSRDRRDGWVGLSAVRKIRREPGSTMASFQRERNGALLGGLGVMLAHGSVADYGSAWICKHYPVTED